MIKDAAAESLSAICQRPNALGVLRNGGWEQTLRNEISFTLEKSGGYFGLTEAVLGNIDRIDVLGRCRQCDENKFGARFAIETKTNFTGQQSQLSHAINKLARLSDENITTYVVYTLTHLRASKGSELAMLHQLTDVCAYKRFTIEEPWNDPPIVWAHTDLPVNQFAGEDVTNGHANLSRPLIGHTTARVGVWVARIEFIQPLHQCKLQWMNQQGEITTQNWNSQGPMLNTKGNLKPPKWSLQ